MLILLFLIYLQQIDDYRGEALQCFRMIMMLVKIGANEETIGEWKRKMDFMNNCAVTLLLEKNTYQENGEGESIQIKIIFFANFFPFKM